MHEAERDATWTLFKYAKTIMEQRIVVIGFLYSNHDVDFWASVKVDDLVLIEDSTGGAVLILADYL